jgi:hypothetical protein
MHYITEEPSVLIVRGRRKTAIHLLVRLMVAFSIPLAEDGKGAPWGAYSRDTNLTFLRETGRRSPFGIHEPEEQPQAGSAGSGEVTCRQDLLH